MGQRSAVPGQRLLIAAVEPAPAHRASGVLVGVVQIVAFVMAAAVGHLRLRKRRRGTASIGAGATLDQILGSPATIAPPATPLFGPIPSTRAPNGGHHFVPIRRAWRAPGVS